VLGTVSTLVASLQVSEALKLLVGEDPDDGGESVEGGSLIDLDLWRLEAAVVPFERDLDCPTCAHHAYELLNTAGGTRSTALCGRDEYQIIPARPLTQSSAKAEEADDDAVPDASPLSPTLNLEQLAQRLRSQGDVLLSPHLLSFSNSSLRFKLFADGRMMLKGAANDDAALSIYAEYVGF
jgi:hypothetical protein